MVPKYSLATSQYYSARFSPNFRLGKLNGYDIRLSEMGKFCFLLGGFGQDIPFT